MQSYDPLHRNPLFCGADHTTLWELQMVRTANCYKAVFFNSRNNKMFEI